MSDPGPSPLSRRRFLVAGVAGAVGLVVAGGAAARSRQSAPSGFEAFFGERTSAVAALGDAVIDAGAAPTATAALLAVLPVGITVEGSGVLDLTDARAFVAGFEAAVADELAVGDLELVGGFPLTPTEAAVAAACALARR